MPPTTLGALYAIAQDVLDVAESATAETQAGTPSRVFVSPSEPAYDCEQLSVHVAQIAEAGTQPQSPTLAPGLRRKLGSVILVTYNVLCIRCGPWPEPGGDPPSVSVIQTASEKVLEDGWSLWNRFHEAINCEEIFETCIGVIFDGGFPVREQGGVVGWRFVFRATLEGMEVNCS